MKRAFWTVCLLLMALNLEVVGKAWNGIVPCKTSRAEVGKVLGKEESTYFDVSVYSYKQIRIGVHYSGVRYLFGEIETPSAHIVERIHVPQTKRPLSLSKYIRSVSNFRREFVMTEWVRDRVGYYATYDNDARGFGFAVEKDAKGAKIVTEFSYYAPEGSCDKRTGWFPRQYRGF